MTDSNHSSTPRWEPVGAVERRLLGVLVEKAKTTPENYPLTANALRNGANQKSNRSPQMALDENQIDELLESLRRKGAVTEVIGSGRVPKYRHRMYEWMGVEKAELAVMAELLLRGAQTVGELRGRAARMEPISDLTALRPHLDNLEAKRLLVYLTPRGRGAVVTHTLYLPDEFEKVRAEYGADAMSVASADRSPSGREQPVPNRLGPPAPGQAVADGGATGARSATASDDVLREIESLRGELSAMRSELSQLKSRLDGDVT